MTEDITSSVLLTDLAIGKKKKKKELSRNFKGE
jgi:hypothetical protein